MSRVRNNNYTIKQNIRKQIPTNLEVTVANNTRGEFVYQTQYDVASLDLKARGDEDYVTFEDLRKMRQWLRNFDLVITGVNSNDYTIMDVARALRVQDVYEKFFDLILQIDKESYDLEQYIDIDEIDGFILEETDNDIFKQALDSDLRKTIIVECVALYREGKLQDYSKMKMIEQTRPEDSTGEREMFWSDMER